MEKLQVATTTNVNKLAGAITEIIKSEKKVTLSAIGAGAVNQSVKAIAVARRFIESYGIELVSTPSFRTSIIDGGERTSIEIIVEGR